MRAVVTGGAGFLGSHLCRTLAADGWDVVAVDNLLTGRRENLAGLDVELVVQDVGQPLTVDGPVDAVLHFASPASPVDYGRFPLETLRAGADGTASALGFAVDHGARFLLASTSEVYGDPLQHPQTETYPGNVNCVGPRSVYDEAKRYAEALTTAYASTYGLDAKIARIFNTYGPGLRAEDGRVVSTFITQALAGAPLTVFGDGSQTRSFCFVDDLIDGILRLLASDHRGPMNLGSPVESTVLELACLVLATTGSKSPITHRRLPVDDPVRRCPDVTLAETVLGWAPKTDLVDGIAETVESFRAR